MIEKNALTPSPAGLYSIRLSVPHGPVIVDVINRSSQAGLNRWSVDFLYTKLSFTPQHENENVKMAGSTNGHAELSEQECVASLPFRFN